jgi:hypothetical protein
MYDFLVRAGLCCHIGALPRQSKPCGILQRQDRLRLAGGQPGVDALNSSSTAPCVPQVSWETDSDSREHKEVSLVYFSTFEPIALTPDSVRVIQQAGVPILYDSASNPRLPCIYICPVANVLGRAPLILCLISFDDYGVLEAPPQIHSDPGIGTVAADSYEVNILKWRYGRGRPRMESIAEAEMIKSELRA